MADSTIAASAAAKDERLAESSLFHKLMHRPELGSVAGFILVIVFFAIYADPKMFTLAGIMNFLEPAAQLGILAIAAALLMIGGEFDLSLGSMIAFAGVALGIPLVVWGWPLWLCIVFAFGVAGVIGLVNGNLVLRTGLPSFIVTLAFLVILRGLTLVILKWGTGGSTQVRGIKDASEGSWLREVFSGNAFEGLFAWMAKQGWIATFKSGVPKVQGIPVELIWFILIAAVATWVLLRTRWGNWIFASGGDPVAARNVGVPVAKVKVGLFITTACAATLVATIQVLDLGSADASRGLLKEFEAIIAAVIGGCLLTGGYGSAIGPFFGALIFGMVSIGITYTDINQDWFKVFLGAMLLTAVIINNIVRKRATEAK